jgi:hypothetical protein
MHALRLLALVSVVWLGGCSGELPLTPDDEWTQARARWDTRGPTNYTFEVRSLCYCIANVNFWHRVEVRGGRVVAVTPVDSVPFPPVMPLTIWPTVPELFERARRTREVTFIERQEVEYDPTVGYPRRISVACGRQIADCDSETTVRNLRGVV